MCFSAAADLTAAGLLVPVSGLSLALVRDRRELPLALLPAVFCVHQFIESFVWRGLDGAVGPSAAHAAAVAYVLIALPLLPALVPVSVLLASPSRRRRPMLPFVALGLLVAGVLLYSVLDGPVGVVPHDHCLEYRVGVPDALLWTVLYVLAVIGPPLLSDLPLLVAFGAANLLGLTVVAIAYVTAFASLWCVLAALSSVLITAHLWWHRAGPPPCALRGGQPPPG